MALTYRFGHFELNPATRQLLIDDQPAPLGTRAFDVLLALIERRDRLVTKNELLDLVWPGLVVEENNLQVQVSALRKLLGPQVILTVPVRGYRFIAAIDGPVPAHGSVPVQIPHGTPVSSATTLAELSNLQTEQPPLHGRSEDSSSHQVKNIALPVDAYRVDLGSVAPQAQSHGHRRWQRMTRALGWRWVAAGVLAVSIAAIAVWTLAELWKPKPAPAPPALSVAVMPLVAPPGDAAMAQKAEAWTRDLTSTLVGRSMVIRVVPAPEVQTKAASDGGIVGVARTLNVRYVIEGQLRPSEDGMLISLRLMNGATGEQIGSEAVFLRATATTQDQTRALRAGVANLKDPLFAAEKRRVTFQPLGDATPMDYVLRAWALGSTEPDTLQRAREQIELYDEALRRDPNLVPALEGLVGALHHEFIYDSHIDRERFVRRMDEVTSRAVNLAPNRAPPWEVRAFAFLYLGQWDASLEANAKAIRIEPEWSDPIAERAGLMNLLGRPVEALTLADQAMAMDPPGDFFSLYQVCTAHMLLGQYELAIADCEKANGLDHSMKWADINLAAAYALRGDTARAAIKRAEVLRAQPGQTIATMKNASSLNPDYVRLSDETIYAGLRKAGVPEK